LKDNREDRKSFILGVGFDGDGHVRITHGKNFHLYGGCEDTHSLMVEKSVKLNEELDKRNRDLDDITGEEFCEIADKIGLKKADPRPKPR